MALSKSSSNSVEQSDEVTLLLPPSKRRIAMGITEEGMGHILARLTDLYTNPIEATARELLSNAQDGTVLMPEAQRKPIEVTLPTSADPYFTVRDFGVGMDLDLIEKIYANYGSSSKRDDYRQTGAYGLGAKAPLAYCTKFRVVTTHEGYTVEFTMARTEEGNFLDVISEGQTGAESGTLVQVPALTHDAEAFEKAVESYRRYSFDASLKINDRVTSADDYIVIEPAFLLDRDEATGVEITGRIWVNRNKIPAFISNRFRARGYSSISTVYALSGWGYKSPSNYYGSTSSATIVVELKPGVVDFASSRDEIMQNDRFKGLENRVNTFLSSGDTESMLAQYRKWSDKDAATMAHALLFQGAINEEGVLELNTADKSVHLTRQDLKTDSGLDPLLPFVDADVTENLVTAAFYAGPSMSGKGMSFVLPRRAQEDEAVLFRVASTELNSASISFANASLLTMFAGKPSISLTRTALSNTTLRHVKEDGNRGALSTMKRIVVVTGEDQVNFKQLLSMRRSLTDLDGRALYFFAPKDSAKLDAQIDVLKKFGDFDDVKKISLTDLVQRVRKARAAERALNKSTGPDTMEILLCSKGEDNEKSAVSMGQRSATSRMRGRKWISVEELKDENAVLILTHGTPASALIGMANAGESIVNRPIYYTDRSRGVKATHLKALADYDGLIMATDYKASSKLATALRETRTRHGLRLDSELKAADTDLVVRSVMSVFRVTDSFLANFHDYLIQTHPQEDKLIWFTSAAQRRGRDLNYSFGRLSPAELESAVGVEYAEVLHNFIVKFRELHDSDELDPYLLASAMETRKTFASKSARDFFMAYAYRTFKV